MSERENPLFGLSQRLPPSNLPAEQALLGAIMANNRAFERVSEFLEPHHFADAIHGRIFEAIQRRITAGQIADAVTLKTEFDNSGILSDVGGAAYLAQLLASMVSIINAGDYGRTIHDAWLRRQLIDIGESAINAAFGADPEVAGEDAVSEAIEQLLSLSEERLSGAGGDMMAAIDAVLNDATAAAVGKKPGGLATGIPTLDAMWRGLVDGNLDILGARPGGGKTALGMQILRHVAEGLRDGEHVQMFSLEMNREKLALRLLSDETGISADDIRQGLIDGDRAELLLAARARLRALPIRVDDTPGQTLADITIKARTAKRRHKTRLILIDHLHRIAPSKDMIRLPRTEQIQMTTRRLKDLAETLGVPILLLAQLSRDNVRRQGKDSARPTTADLKYAGEDDADNIILLWRPAEHMDEAPPESNLKNEELVAKAKDEWWKRKTFWKSKAEAIFAKRRFGATGHVILTFDGVRTRFTDMEPSS